MEMKQQKCPRIIIIIIVIDGEWSPMSFHSMHLNVEQRTRT